MSAAVPSDRSELGAHAKRLLEDPVLMMAFDLIERDLVNTILTSPVGGTEQREAAYRLHWAAQQVRLKLRTMLGDSKLLAAEQQRRENTVK